MRAPNDPPPALIDQGVAPVLRALRAYHRYQAVNLESFPKTGPVILACSHSFATYDGFLLGLELYEKLGRLPVGLGDDLIFRLPGLRQLADQLGLVPASPTAAEELLAAGHLLALAPGGMREALRPSTEAYRVRWQRRRGFARLAIRTGVPIVLAAGAPADDIFSVTTTPLTALAYRHLKIPLPLVRGLGLSLIPRPVRLWHLLSEPIPPPPFDPNSFEEDTRAWHKTLTERMDQLMDQAKPKRRGIFRWF